MKNTHFISLLFVLALAIPVTAMASVISFEFTGRVTVLDMNGVFAPAGGLGSSELQAPIHSTFTYDTNSGLGSGDIIISPLKFMGLDTQFREISLASIEGTNYVLGNMLVDWGSADGIPVSMVWDATGLLNAIDYGLQPGDVVSGTNLKRNGLTVLDVNSAIPASDGDYYNNAGGYTVNQGPAPLATTTLNTTPICDRRYIGGRRQSEDCMGLAVSGMAPFFDDGIAGSPLVDGPFPSFQISIDIGSGNSLTVLSVASSTPVPVPAAVWLFGSGLLGLIGVARRN